MSSVLYFSLYIKATAGGRGLVIKDDTVAREVEWWPLSLARFLPRRWWAVRPGAWGGVLAVL